jgi:hypothetical protein
LRAILLGLSIALVPVTSATGSEAGALTVDQAVTTYAPAVYLHPDEAYRPIASSTFIRASTLIWHHDGGCKDFVLDEHPDSVKMATGGYTRRAKQNFFKGCDDEGRAYASNENVRPRGSGNVAGGEGMFLDLPNSLHGGYEGTATPIYYDVRGPAGARAVNYWFSYGYSRSKFNNRPDGGHDGDWEHITVLLGKGNRARDIYYAQHDGGCLVAADARDRPSVYSAKGSHASYPKPGDYEHKVPEYANATLQDEARGGGALWDARKVLRRLSDEPWYGKESGQGFGGGWGEVGELSETTGPAGPHREYKTGLPEAGAGPCPEPVRPA